MKTAIARLSVKERLSGKIAPQTEVALRKAWSLSSWWPRIMESFTGAWQQNVVVDHASVSANWAVFSCITLIANDIAKMPARVMLFSESKKIWEQQAGLAVLDRPNPFQLWPDFVRSWVFSLLLRGNTYVLRVVNRTSGFVDALYVLDPSAVKPLVTPSGDVYYQVSADNLVGIDEAVVVPASQIIHDRINALFHPLVGLSPIFACGVAAMQSLAMQSNSMRFFANMSRPGGILTAPGHVSDESAARLKEVWETNFSGDSAGKIAVVGDGLKFEPLAMTAVDSQLIEQLKFTGEMVCATFHVPSYKLGIGTPPSVGNLAALNQQYYDQCLHPFVDAMERRLDVGLGMGFPRQVWLDTEELLRMDPATRWDSYAKAMGSAGMGPNEIRRKENLPPVAGGDTPYLQQQNYSLAALAKRDAKDDPFAKAETPKPPAPAAEEDVAEESLKDFDCEAGLNLFHRVYALAHAEQHSEARNAT